MTDINIYISEFVAVTKHLLKQDILQKRGLLCAEKPDVIQLLQRNLYEEPQAKLQLWKALRWIRTDEGYITRRIYLQERKTYRRLLAIDLSMYETLRNFVR